MNKQVIIMLCSMLMGLICFLIMGYAYAENIGDGSWNETIFLSSLVGIFISIALFFLALIWAIIRGLLRK